MIQFEKIAWTDRRTERFYFMGPFQLPQGVQKFKKGFLTGNKIN